VVSGGGVFGRKHFYNNQIVYTISLHYWDIVVFFVCIFFCLDITFSDIFARFVYFATCIIVLF